jgi:hypothetical protein
MHRYVAATIGLHDASDQHDMQAKKAARSQAQQTCNRNEWAARPMGA